MAHIPGPYDHSNRQIFKGEKFIAAVWCMWDSDEEIEATTRLLAAAPDLLAACEAVLHSTSFTEIGRLARAAIAKATGAAATPTPVEEYADDEGHLPVRDGEGREV